MFLTFWQVYLFVAPVRQVNVEFGERIFRDVADLVNCSELFSDIAQKLLNRSFNLCIVFFFSQDVIEQASLVCPFFVAGHYLVTPESEFVEVCLGVFCFS